MVDEPMVGLDPKSARLLKDLFREFVDRGGTVLMSTHTMEIAEVMCDRIAIVYRGKIAAQGTMAELRRADVLGGHEPGGPVPQADRRPPGRISSTRCSTRDRRDADVQPGAVDHAHPEAARRRSRALRQERSGRWAKVLLLALAGVGVLDRRSSASPTGCCATSSTCRTSATSSPARCSASSCSRSSPFCCSPTSSRHSRPSSSPRISTSWSAAPIGWLRLYLAKLSETVVHSSWMVALLALPDPDRLRHGVLRRAALSVRRARPPCCPILVLPAVAGAIFTVLLVNVFPARRTRELLGLIGLGAVAVVVLLLRFIRPERLARPEGFRNFLDYLAVLRTPTSPLAAERVGRRDAHELADAGWRTPGRSSSSGRRRPCALASGAAVHRAAVPRRATRRRRKAPSGRCGGRSAAPRRPCLDRLPPQKREFLFKDMRLFFRDNTQWSQLILLVVLLADLHLQHQVAADPLGRADPVRAGDDHLVPQPGARRASCCPRWRRGSSSRASRSRGGRCGCCARARSIRAAMLWSKYWMGTVPLLVLAVGITVADQRPARGEPVHDGGEPARRSCSTRWR